MSKIFAEMRLMSKLFNIPRHVKKNIILGKPVIVCFPLPRPQWWRVDSIPFQRLVDRRPWPGVVELIKIHGNTCDQSQQQLNHIQRLNCGARLWRHITDKRERGRDTQDYAATVMGRLCSCWVFSMLRYVSFLLPNSSETHSTSSLYPRSWTAGRG